MNQDSEEEDGSDSGSEEEEEADKHGEDVDMDGPTRDELEKTAEGEFDLSEDEDGETGIVLFSNINPNLQV